VGYRNPTLIETYAELHLAPGSLNEAAYFKVVPKLTEAGFTEVELSTAGVSFEARPGRRVFPREQKRVRCWKPDRTELVQVGEDLLVVNLPGAYPGWDPFVTLFGKGLRALEAGLGQVKIQSLNLMTVDQFKVPQIGFNLSQYVNVGGPMIPAWYDRTTQSLDISLGRGLLEHDGKNRQLAVAVRAAEDPVTIEFRAAFHDVLSPESDLGGALEVLHNESNDMFESIITDRTRNEVMGGRNA
jgi:uncharacterized protein (TIGR04255 family)